MALYSQRIKTRDLDPSSFVANQSATFKLPNNACFYPNMRIANLGYAGAGDKHYNLLAGVYSCIRHIRLTSDGMVLSQMRFANGYMAFKALNDKNSNNNLVNSVISKNSVGYETHFQHNGGLENRHREKMPTAIAGAEHKLGWLDLRRVFPILSRMSSVDTRVFKNLVVHIEFQSDANTLCSSQDILNSGDDLSATAITIGKPVLIVDEIEDMAVADRLKNSMKSIVWDEIEHDRANLSAVAVQATGVLLPVESSVKLNGFSGKFINRILFRKMFSQNMDTGNNDNGRRKRKTGGLGSVALNGEKWNYRIDGAKVFPADLDKKNQILKLMADTYGDLNIVPFGDKETVGSEYLDDAANHNAITRAGVDRIINLKQGNLVGNVSYVGFGLNQKVNDFQVDFTRNATSDNRGTKGSNNQAIEIHAYAEVRKNLVINSDGSFNIAYV